MAKMVLFLRIMSATLAHPVNSVSELVAALPTVSASDLKNSFGEVTTRALKGALAIKRHSRAEFVLMPMEEYVALQEARMAPLAELSAKFDAMVIRMNTPGARRAGKSLFGATSAALGKSAMKAARSHGG